MMNENNGTLIPQSKALFVDDELSILKSLRRAFLKSDFLVFIAHSAQEAIELLEKENIDVIVTDYRMPKMNGHAKILG